MPIHDLTKEHLDYHKGCINALREDTPRLWGTMDATQMLCHLRTVIGLSLDDPDGTVKIIAPPVLRDVIGFLFFDTFTNWPKGKLKAPKYMTPAHHSGFNEERRMVLDTLDRFVARHATHPAEKHVSPLLGPVPLKRWAHVHGVHNNHHYSQFGVV